MPRGRPLGWGRRPDEARGRAPRRTAEASASAVRLDAEPDDGIGIRADGGDSSPTPPMRRRCVADAPARSSVLICSDPTRETSAEAGPLGQRLGAAGPSPSSARGGGSGIGASGASVLLSVAAWARAPVGAQWCPTSWCTACRSSSALLRAQAAFPGGPLGGQRRSPGRRQRWVCCQCTPPSMLLREDQSKEGCSERPGGGGRQRRDEARPEVRDSGASYGAGRGISGLPTVAGVRDREQAPQGFGTVQLVDAKGSETCHEVVRALYGHIQNGAARCNGIIYHKKYVVHVPEIDLAELMQVSESHSVMELRRQMERQTGRRAPRLKMFHSDGSSLKRASASSGHMLSSPTVGAGALGRHEERTHGEGG
ncbi:unnamed protein product [Prorocentrum cordatum]|uniref:Uncharacterized protein n=1 Tax=Prorocentrum cordatum TaxID=2364126 RepID=A0ABN9TYH9_9DINO|nr:unnamed protein product [Polarella glacialis]